MTFDNGVAILLDVIPQLLFHRFKGHVERLLKRSLHRHLRVEQFDKLAQLVRFALSAENQVVHERPRLRVKNALLVCFVVLWRLVINFEQRAQRQHLVVAKQKDVIGDRTSEHDLLIVGDAERTVVFGKSFVEPYRSGIECVFDEQMCVLVKDDRKRVLLPSRFGS